MYYSYDCYYVCIVIAIFITMCSGVIIIITIIIMFIIIIRILLIIIIHIILTSTFLEEMGIPTSTF